MRKLLAAIILLGFVAWPPTVAAADARDITVVNKTGKPIYSLFISPTDSENWEEDVPGADVLPDGESVHVTFSGYNAKQCSFDILATDEDDNEWLLPDVDLCSVSEVVVTAKYIRAKTPFAHWEPRCGGGRVECQGSPSA